MANVTYVDDIEAMLQVRLPQCPPGLLPFYVLLVLAKGATTTAEDVHDAWSVWMAPQRSDHRSLVPFEDLPAGIQAHDDIPMAAIHEVAALTRKGATT